MHKIKVLQKKKKLRVENHSKFLLPSKSNSVPTPIGFQKSSVRKAETKLRSAPNMRLGEKVGAGTVEFGLYASFAPRCKNIPMESVIFPRTSVRDEDGRDLGMKTTRPPTSNDL
ncbi:hypothetical protein JTE90_000888 [Oedothorax gibbosus]|uniref:Uncharacterized protein n=1 Tax=Oedothorax gibbosus TaxID=931172 RepID=A0AAV6VTG4_9ARAC|nr:hypothetical protein JTE90_000888 [Oedothorax gibbosus]